MLGEDVVSKGLVFLMQRLLERMYNKYKVLPRTLTQNEPQIFFTSSGAFMDSRDI